jgi:hypothetical protein
MMKVGKPASDKDYSASPIKIKIVQRIISHCLILFYCQNEESNAKKINKNIFNIFIVFVDVVKKLK